MSSTAAVKRKNMKHYSVGSIIWIIVEYASLIFSDSVQSFRLFPVSQRHLRQMPSTRIPMLWHFREAG